MKILVFNAGSSSLKFELFETANAKNTASDRTANAASVAAKNGLKSIFKGHFDNHGKEIKNFEKEVGRALGLLRAKCFALNAAERSDEIAASVAAIGHRVVHGGDLYSKPTPITSKVLSALEKLSFLAPLHNPPNLAVIRACRKFFPKTPQIAVFDTAFFRTIPEKAYLYGLPFSLSKRLRIKRYGFHGISHQYVFEQALKRLSEKATARTITCHLGNGCSIAAVKNGKAIDISMGFTPLEGVPMGTRSGDIDPSIIFYLLKKGLRAPEIEKILNKKSGLLGVSEFSSDMRDLWTKYKKGDKSAARTLDWFAYRIAKYIGAFAAALRGVDCIVFTGGIGEHAYYIRREIMKYIIGFPLSRVLVIPTDEERKIAEETMKFCS